MKTKTNQKQKQQQNQDGLEFEDHGIKGRSVDSMKQHLIQQFVIRGDYGQGQRKGQGKGEEQVDVEGKLVKCLMEMMDQLHIKYDANQKDDFYELAYIMCELLQYPNSRAAEIHSNAARMGIRDMQQKQDQLLNSRCPCCGLILQPKELDFSTELQHLHNIGTSAYYYMFSLAMCIVLLATMFLIFGIFSTISNFSTSRTYKEDTNASMSQKMFQSYQIPSAFSFGSQQFHPTSFARISVILQGYLGVFTLIFWNLLFQLYRMTENQTQFKTSMQKHSVSTYTLFCTNMPIENSYNPNKLEMQVKKKVQPFILKHKLKAPSISIQNISCINPFNVSVYNLPSKTQYDDKTREVKKQAQVFREWLSQRKTSLQFSQPNKEKRKEQYQKFLELREQRYQLCKKLVQQYRISIRNDTQSQSPTHIDAFVTFSSPVVPYLVLQTERQEEGLIKDVKNYFSKKEMHWTSAPQPEDVKWENYGQGAWEKLFRNLVTVVITISVLSVSFFLLYNLSRFKLSALANNSGSKDGFVIDFFVSIGLSIPIYAINFFIKMLFEYLSRNWERNTTNSAEQVSLARKTLLVMLLNSIGIPVLINLIYRENIYGVDGLADEVFYFALTNAILSPALKILNVTFCINRLKKWYCHWACNKLDMNQRELNLKTEYMPFEIGLESASIIFTFLYTCFFAPLQPIIILFSVCGLLLGYNATLFVIYKMSRRLISCNAEIHKEMVKLIYFGSLLYTLGSFCWTDLYAISVSHYRVTNFLALGLSILAFYVGRYKFLLRKFIDTFGRAPQPLDLKQIKSIQQKNLSQQIWSFIDSYDRLNPSTRTEDKLGLKQKLLKIRKYQSLNPQYMKMLKRVYETKWELTSVPGLGYDDESFVKFGGSFVYC